MNQPPEFLSLVERNFSAYSVPTNVGLRYLRHPSGVVILTLGAEHELMRSQISTISWNVSSGKRGKGRGVDRSKLEPSGKGKKGGLAVAPDTRICIVKDSNGKEFPIRAGIAANLVEVNERLDVEPNLMRTARDCHGFIAILMPRSMATPKSFEREGETGSGEALD